MTGLTSQYIGAVTALCFIVAFIVYAVAALHFYYYKLDIAIELTRHPMAQGRRRRDISLYENLTICTTLAVWLAFPKADFWPMSNIHALFRNIDPMDIPRSIKLPLFLAYGAMFTAFLILVIGANLRSMYL